MKRKEKKRKGKEPKKKKYATNGHEDRVVHSLEHRILQGFPPFLVGWLVGVFGGWCVWWFYYVYNTLLTPVVLGMTLVPTVAAVRVSHASQT